MKTEWSAVKKQRAAILGSYRCEICGKVGSPQETIGHHTLPKKQMKENRSLMVPELCRLRCRSCEQDCHNLFRNGNTPKDVDELTDYFRFLYHGAD